MFNLVLKDFLIQKKGLIFSLIYCIVFTIMFQAQSNASLVFVAVPSVVAFLLIQYACAYDDKNKSYVMLNSLPISRKDIVISKYISMLIFILVGIAMTIVLTTLLQLMGLNKIGRGIRVEEIIGCFSSIIILSSIYFPMYFKLGYLKAKYVNTALVLIAFFFPALIIKDITSKSVPPKFITYLSTQPDWLIGSATLGIVLTILIISVITSLQLYKNKDL